MQLRRRFKPVGRLEYAKLWLREMVTRAICLPFNAALFVFGKVGHGSSVYNLDDDALLKLSSLRRYDKAKELHCSVVDGLERMRGRALTYDEKKDLMPGAFKYIEADYVTLYDRIYVYRKQREAKKLAKSS